MLAPTATCSWSLQIDEKNLGLLTLGQQALGSADAYPDSASPPCVTYINPGVDIARASVQVKLDGAAIRRPICART